MKFYTFFQITVAVIVIFTGYNLDINLRTRFHWIPWLIVAIFMILNILFNTKMINKFYNGAYKDTLTKLNNRGFFYSRMVKELHKLKGNKSHLSLIMIDIDDFKSINDTYGHIAGDEILKQLADIFIGNIRNTDVVARWGGEEFAIILPNTDAKKAVKFGERIRAVVNSHSFYYKDAWLSVTVSMGVATIDENTQVDSFVELADKALYKAKEKKNLVILYEK